MTAPVRIERIAAGGEGLGHLADGRAVFIPRTAPGDLVEPIEVRLHARFARARLGRLLETGPDRVQPLCAHYLPDLCGGCQLQHLSADAQRAARRHIVGDALRRIGQLQCDDPEIEPGNLAWNYRARITLAVTGGNRKIGFHPLERPRAVFDLRRCEIADELLNTLVPLPFAVRRALPAGVRGIGIRVGSAGGVHVVLRGPVRPSAGRLHRLSGALRDASTPVTLWWRPRPGVTRLLHGSPEDGPAGSFEQVQPAMGDRVRRHAVELLDPVAGLLVWDLYAGLGQTGALLADGGARVESVELDREAVAHGARMDPRSAIRRYPGRVEEWIGRLEPPDVVIANPPRSGLGRLVTDRLLDAAPARIVYVSCNPATLARDLWHLVGRGAASSPGYRVTSVRAFDLFPQTAHVETVVGLEHR